MVLAALVVMCMPITPQEDAAVNEAKRKKRREEDAKSTEDHSASVDAAHEVDLIEAGPEMRRL